MLTTSKTANHDRPRKEFEEVWKTVFKAQFVKLNKDNLSVPSLTKLRKLQNESEIRFFLARTQTDLLLSNARSTNSQQHDDDIERLVHLIATKAYEPTDEEIAFEHMSTQVFSNGQIPNSDSPTSVLFSGDFVKAQIKPAKPPILTDHPLTPTNIHLTPPINRRPRNKLLALQANKKEKPMRAPTSLPVTCKKDDQKRALIIETCRTKLEAELKQTGTRKNPKRADDLNQLILELQTLPTARIIENLNAYANKYADDISLIKRFISYFQQQPPAQTKTATRIRNLATSINAIEAGVSPESYSSVKPY